MITPASTDPHPSQFTETFNNLGATVTGMSEAATESLFALISQQKFFSGMSEPHLRLLAESALEMEFEPGQSILQEGTPANRFFLILEGKVVLESELEDRGVVNIQTLGPGDELGWSWLFPAHYVHLTARAMEPTKAIFFYGTRLQEQCENDHDLGYQLMKRVVEVVIQRLQATQELLMECTITSKRSSA